MKVWLWEAVLVAVGEWVKLAYWCWRESQGFHPSCLLPQEENVDLEESFRWGRDRSMIQKVLTCLFSTLQNTWKREFGHACVAVGKSSWWHRQRCVQGSWCYQLAFLRSCPTAITATAAPVLTTLSGSPSIGDCRAPKKVSQVLSCLWLGVKWGGQRQYL